MAEGLANGTLMLNGGTQTGTGSDQDTNAWGLPYNHAFTILQVITVTDNG